MTDRLAWADPLFLRLNLLVLLVVVFLPFPTRLVAEALHDASGERVYVTMYGLTLLVQQAGAAGKTITIGTSSQLLDVGTITGAYQAAAQAIGLKVVLKSVSAQNYINFFIDPKARAGVDGFISVSYGADPAALLSTLVLPGGSQNYDNFNSPKITAAMEQARSTASPDQRAALVATAEKLTAQQLPWIPDVQPTNVLVLGKGLTGAVSSFAYMFAPWANHLGRTG